MLRDCSEVYGYKAPAICSSTQLRLDAIGLKSQCFEAATDVSSAADSFYVTLEGYILFETRTGDEKDDNNSLQRFGVLHLLQREE